jgi:hypothetical protein
MELKGTWIVIVSLILISINTVYLFIMGYYSVISWLGYINIVDIILISLCLKGYLKGQREWAIFSIIYGSFGLVFGILLSIYYGQLMLNLFILGTLMLFAGISPFLRKLRENDTANFWLFTKKDNFLMDPVVPILGVAVLVFITVLGLLG